MASTLLIAGCVALLVILALGVGLGIGLTRNKEDPVQNFSQQYSSKYCTPNDICWPNSTVWTENFQKSNTQLKERYISDYKTCTQQGSDAREISATGDGICMQYHNCRYEFCEVDSKIWNIPEYTVIAKTVQDIKNAIEFANEYNIPVTVKTTGHNYAGSSTGRGTLNIYMRDFEEGVTLKTNGEFSDSCGTNYAHTVKVGGGRVWEEVYGAVGREQFKKYS